MRSTLVNCSLTCERRRERRVLVGAEDEDAEWGADGEGHFWSGVLHVPLTSLHDCGDMLRPCRTRHGINYICTERRESWECWWKKEEWFIWESLGMLRRPVSTSPLCGSEP